MKQRFFLLFVVLFAIEANGAEFKVVTEHLPPLQYGKHNIAVGGFSTEVVQLLLKEVNEPVNIIVANWARAYQMALNEENVLIFSMTRNPKREALFKWVGSVVEFDNYLWRLSWRDDLLVNRLEDAKKFRISVPRSDSQHQFLLAHGFKEKEHLLVVADFNGAADLLLKGRVEYFAGAKLFLFERLKQRQLEPHIIKPMFKLNRSTNYIAFSYKTSDLRVEKFRVALDRLKDSQEYAAILQKWQGHLNK